MTPKIFEKYINAFKKRQGLIDAHNYNLGKYVAIAVNDPKKYPKKPFLANSTSDSSKTMSAEEMEKEGERLALKFNKNAVRRPTT